MCEDDNVKAKQLTRFHRGGQQDLSSRDDFRSQLVTVDPGF